MKINTRLLLAFLLIALVPLGVVSALFYFTTRDAVTDSVLSHLDSVATIQDSRLESIVNHNLDVLNLVASKTQFRLALDSYIKERNAADLERMNKALLDTRAAVASLRHITVVGVDGEILASTGTQEVGSTMRDSQVFIQGKTGNSADTLFLDQDDNLCIYLVGPLYLEDKLLGVVVIESLANDILLSVNDYTGLGATGETYIAKKNDNGDAVFLTPTRFDERAALKRMTSHEDLNSPMLTALSGQENLFTDAVDYRGRKVLAATRYCENAGWGLVTQIDRAEALAPVNRLLAFLATGAFLCLSFILFFSLFLSKGITKPIVKLASVAARIEEGDLTARAETGYSDETGILAHAFNRMTESLLKNKSELEDNIRELAARDEQLQKELAERKRTEEQYRLLAEHTADIIYRLEIATERYTYVSPSVEHLLGYSADEALSLHPQDVLTTESYQKQYGAMMAAISSRTTSPETLHLEAVHKDGHVVPVEVRASFVFGPNKNPIEVVGVARDITERKQAEAERLKLRLAVETSGEVVFLTDVDGIIRFVNPEFTRIYGYTADEVVGKVTPRILKSGRMKQSDYELFWQSLLAKQITKGELINKTKDGRFLNVEGSASPALDEQGNIIGFLAVQRDVTERKKMEEQLLVTNRLASVGELASGVAHELNNPLTSVMGFAELLLERDVPDDVKEDLRVIDSEAKRAATVVKNLLTFARKHVPKKQPVDIHSAIQRVLELRAYEERVNNIQVMTHFVPDLPLITGNGFELQQVFLNIIINAEYFMAEARGKGSLNITTERNGDKVRVSFADDGPGIPPENVERLFTPFFTTKEVGKGTGLGLSICHGIITAHGGKISVESEPGKGATFIIELPIVENDRGESAYERLLR